jgi:UDP-N-acetylglucosamine 2-epimerase (non-hydrolysing)
MKDLVKVIVTFGTRPEALKLAPLITELRARLNIFRTQVCVTAQHRQMLDQVLQLFSIEPDFDLNLMEEGQSLAGFGSRALLALDGLFRKEKPDIVLVQGDTTTTFAAALAGFYQGAKIAHVEAGLRSFNKQAPFPEEINRRLTTHLTDLHFAPTEGARRNLIHEGIEVDKILVTGNTIVDTLQQIISRLDSGNLDTSLRQRFPEMPSKVILVTVHRREIHGKKLREICSAVRELSDLFPHFHFLFPVHLHPQVQAPVNEILSGLPCVHLLPPLDYPSFVWLMQHSCLILSDSGGVQEECCALGKQVLVMREVTERYEAVESGFARLVGCDRGRIVAAAFETLTKNPKPDVDGRNPFGDGHAAERIANALASLEQVST